MVMILSDMNRSSYVPISQHNQEKNKKRRADGLSVCRQLQKYRRMFTSDLQHIAV